MSLQIRRYEPADHDAVVAINDLSLNIVGAHPGPSMFVDLEDIQGVYLDKQGEFLVGVFEGEVVAMGAFKRIDDGVAEVTRMRIHPGHQRQGYGQAILSALEARAREMGYRTLHLETTTQQVAAQGLYAANGFVQTGTGKYEEFTLLQYEKPLT
jgi:ribosomal protein S18 acetylase RimI-like enzyme